MVAVDAGREGGDGGVGYGGDRFLPFFFTWFLAFWLGRQADLREGDNRSSRV